MESGGFTMVEDRVLPKPAPRGNDSRGRGGRTFGRGKRGGDAGINGPSADEA